MIQGRFDKKIKIILISLICSVFFLLPACAAWSVDKDDSVRVTLMDSEFFEMQEGSSRTVFVEPGSRAVFIIDVKEGYFVSAVDYPDTNIDEGINGITRLSLPAVSKSIRVRVFCAEDTMPYITYDANGGGYLNSGGPYRMRYNPESHFRINTSIGTDQITRDGYTLLGWNTASDGSGVSYGLGSRCDVAGNAFPYLYAQWVQWTQPDVFEFTSLYGNQKIIGYSGDEEVICIPAQLDGLSVKRINGGTFVGCRAKTVILPTSIEIIESGAFENCALQELYFYDNLVEIHDDSFVNCPNFSTIHINAKLFPCYSDFDRHSNYADKVDILRKYQDKNKIVLFGGCGTYFSIVSSLIYEAFGGEYEVVNMGLNGWFPGVAQSEVIINFLQPGDILLHIPEMSSECQLFKDVNFAPINNLYESGYDDRYFTALESDYDILNFIDIRGTSGIFDCFTRYNYTKKHVAITSYSNNAGFIDDFGDYAFPKSAWGKDERLSQEAGIQPNYLTAESLERLNGFYAKANANGAHVFATYAAVNLDGLVYQDGIDGTNYLELAAEYECLFEEGIENATVIGKIEEAFFHGSVFFDSDWHLADEAAVRNTENILRYLKAAL